MFSRSSWQRTREKVRGPARNKKETRKPIRAAASRTLHTLPHIFYGTPHSLEAFFVAYDALAGNRGSPWKPESTYSRRKPPEQARAHRSIRTSLPMETAPCAAVALPGRSRAAAAEGTVARTASAAAALLDLRGRRVSKQPRRRREEKAVIEAEAVLVVPWTSMIAAQRIANLKNIAAS